MAFALTSGISLSSLFSASTIAPEFAASGLAGETFLSALETAVGIDTAGFISAGVSVSEREALLRDLVRNDSEVLKDILAKVATGFLGIHRFSNGEFSSAIPHPALLRLSHRKTEPGKFVALESQAAFATVAIPTGSFVAGAMPGSIGIVSMSATDENGGGSKTASSVDIESFFLKLGKWEVEKTYGPREILSLAYRTLETVKDIRRFYHWFVGFLGRYGIEGIHGPEVYTYFKYLEELPLLANANAAKNWKGVLGEIREAESRSWRGKEVSAADISNEILRLQEGIYDLEFRGSSSLTRGLEAKRRALLNAVSNLFQRSVETMHLVLQELMELAARNGVGMAEFQRDLSTLVEVGYPLLEDVEFKVRFNRVLYRVELPTSSPLRKFLALSNEPWSVMGPLRSVKERGIQMSPEAAAFIEKLEEVVRDRGNIEALLDQTDEGVLSELKKLGGFIEGRAQR